MQIVALEEHVDYWDDQGWRDPFSSHNWTTRQDAYAGVLGNKNPYTPQIVVDGSVECSGGRPQLAQAGGRDASKLDAALEAARVAARERLRADD